ncbi:unnamed protein product [Alternaria alternata]|nr:hypothetical protein AALT_g5398 [Alternaria alternata]
MRLNAIILVTGLLAFANADLVARKDIDYNKGAPESHGVIGKAGDDACVALGCDASLPACLEQCAPGLHCEDYCACYLHSNPESICRQQGCVKAPQDCDKWELTERDTASAGSAIADSDSIAVGDQQSPPIDHCQVCRAAVYTCQQNCRAVTSARLPPVLPLLKQQTPMTPSHPQLTIAKSAGPPSTPVNKTAMVTRHARQGAYAPALSGKAAASASPSIVRALRVKRPLMFLRYERP